MSKILVTGANGLVGHALRRICSEFNGDEFVFYDRAKADLTKEQDVCEMYKNERPDYVIHTAARVGGIGLNLAKPAEMFYQNILMNSFMIHYANLNNVKKIICYTSACTFPHNVPILKEELQQTGKPWDDNFAYGYAKRMVDIQIRAYRQQHKVNYCSVVPTNLYGPNDNFSLEDGHVIAALVHKCYMAKKNSSPLVLWGDGSSLREFIYSDDVARLTVMILKNTSITYDKVIVSNTIEMSIKKICQIICEEMGFGGEIVFDTDKPNGQFRRPSDTSRLHSIIPDIKFTDHRIGIRHTIDWFSENYPEVRL